MIAVVVDVQAGDVIDDCDDDVGIVVVVGGIIVIVVVIAVVIVLMVVGGAVLVEAGNVVVKVVAAAGVGKVVGGGSDVGGSLVGVVGEGSPMTTPRRQVMPGCAPASPGICALGGLRQWRSARRGWLFGYRRRR